MLAGTAVLLVLALLAPLGSGGLWAHYAQDYPRVAEADSGAEGLEGTAAEEGRNGGMVSRQSSRWAAGAGVTQLVDAAGLQLEGDAWLVDCVVHGPDRALRSGRVQALVLLQGLHV